MSNYIFLDIDGVLNDYKDHLDILNPQCQNNFYKINESSFIEKNKLRLLHDLVYKTQSEIIGISDWFILYDKEVIEKIIKLPIFDVIEKTTSDVRGFEILKWLENRNYSSKKDFFVVLDDIQKRSFKYPKVNIKSTEGFTKENYKEALSYFNRSQNIQEYKKLYK